MLVCGARVGQAGEIAVHGPSRLAVDPPRLSHLSPPRGQSVGGVWGMAGGWRRGDGVEAIGHRLQTRGPGSQQQGDGSVQVKQMPQSPGKEAAEGGAQGFSGTRGE